MARTLSVHSKQQKKWQHPTCWTLGPGTWRVFPGGGWALLPPSQSPPAQQSPAEAQTRPGKTSSGSSSDPSLSPMLVPPGSSLSRGKSGASKKQLFPVSWLQLAVWVHKTAVFVHLQFSSPCLLQIEEIVNRESIQTSTIQFAPIQQVSSMVTKMFFYGFHWFYIQISWFAVNWFQNEFRTQFAPKETTVHSIRAGYCVTCVTIFTKSVSLSLSSEVLELSSPSERNPKLKIAERKPSRTMQTQHSCCLLNSGWELQIWMYLDESCWSYKVFHSGSPRSLVLLPASEVWISDQRRLGWTTCSLEADLNSQWRTPSCPLTPQILFLITVCCAD